jgi:DNA-directed RNA polymerase subunit RPC12/RpoP
MSQVVVSTECPTCSGPLDFSEGVNAIRCPSCGSTLLVTGRKQVLSYWVAPRIKADVAGAAARTGRLPARVLRSELFFVPFYRLTGHDFQWQDAPPRPAPEREVPSMLFGGGDTTDRPEIDISVGSILSWGADTLLGTRAGDVVRDAFGEASRPEHAREPIALVALRSTKTSTADSTGQFLDRYLEQSFPAADLPGLGVASLGVRTQALRVSLFQRDTLAALGTIVSVQTDEASALRQGLAARGFEHVVYRQVLGRVLSVIYFPFWVIELAQDAERWLTVVDAVAESVVQPRASLALYDALVQKPDTPPRTVGLRPLVCPNCGGALPLEADDVIFPCSSCGRAWQINGADLTEMPHEIARIPSLPDRSSDVIFLPFWRLDPAPGAAASPACVPAFRCLRLKILNDLAARFAAKPPVYETGTGERSHARGCFYDVEDAVLLARFTAAGRRQIPDAVKAAAADEPSFAGARLVWIPFKREGQSLLDPFSGLALQEALLD